jgi:hypothetical protein
MKEFTVYHNESPRDSDSYRFFEWDRIEKGNLKKVATVRTPSLNDVYRLTNHIDRAWWENDGVEVVEPAQHSSTSVGDLIVDETEGKAYQVASFGFTEVEDKGDAFEAIKETAV